MLPMAPHTGHRLIERSGSRPSSGLVVGTISNSSSQLLQYTVGMRSIGASIEWPLPQANRRAGQTRKRASSNVARRMVLSFGCPGRPARCQRKGWESSSVVAPAAARIYVSPGDRGRVLPAAFLGHPWGRLRFPARAVPHLVCRCSLCRSRVPCVPGWGGHSKTSSPANSSLRRAKQGSGCGRRHRPPADAFQAAPQWKRRWPCSRRSASTPKNQAWTWQRTQPIRDRRPLALRSIHPQIDRGPERSPARPGPRGC